MAVFYRDLGRPDVEHFARAICRERGLDPDEMVQESGYSKTVTVPCWLKYQDPALDFVAMLKAASRFNEPPITPPQEA